MMPNQTPNTKLTLSAVPEQRPQVDRTPAAANRATLCRTCGSMIVATRVGLWLHAHPAAPPITESELRLMDGNR